MVCLGNICRSPLAEALLAAKLPKDRFTVDSAGTGSWHIGKQPDSRSIAIAKLNGLDISSQKGRQFSESDFDEFDHIYVMDGNNYRDVANLAKTEQHRAKIHLILNEMFPGENVDVPDPYFGMEKGFETVYKMLDETTAIIAKKLLSER